MRRGKKGRPLSVVPRPMIAADRVMVGDGATRGDQRIARGALDRAPLCQQIPVSSESMECEVGCRPVRVDMSEPASDLARPPGGVANRRLRSPFLPSRENSSNRSQVIAVSKVSAMMARRTRRSRA